MVNSMKQARSIQERRVLAGRKGAAVAVRRFLKRGRDLTRNAQDYEDYLQDKANLPSLPISHSEESEDE